jgi:hypothetical protein
MARRRPDGYIADVESRAHVVYDTGDLLLMEEDWHALAEKYRAPKKEPSPRRADFLQRALAQFTDEQRAVMAYNAEQCRDCSMNRNKGSLPVLTVGCNKCGCGGLHLLRGECELGKWKSSESV